jgi:hypothetical protein
MEDRLERLNQHLNRIEKNHEGGPLPNKHAQLQKQFDTIRKVSDDFSRSNNRRYGSPTIYGPKQSKAKETENRRRGNEKNQRESYDIYDIILSHLLDEGYAETPEAAERIMVNMSEEWRDSIIG